MTTAELLTKARTLLDESAASYWTDNEIYSALNSGQTEVINHGISFYSALRKKDRNYPLPELLRPLLTTATGTITMGNNTYNLPADYLLYVNVYYNKSAGATDADSLYVREYSNRGHKSRNTYLVEAYRYCNIDATKITVEMSTGEPQTQYITLEYIKKPSAIASGVNPTLLAYCDNAIVYFCMHELLLKDQRTNVAQMYLAISLEEIKKLLEM